MDSRIGLKCSRTYSWCDASEKRRTPPACPSAASPRFFSKLFTIIRQLLIDSVFFFQFTEINYYSHFFQRGHTLNRFWAWRVGYPALISMYSTNRFRVWEQGYPALLFSSIPQEIRRNFMYRLIRFPICGQGYPALISMYSTIRFRVWEQGYPALAKSTLKKMLVGISSSLDVCGRS